MGDWGEETQDVSWKKNVVDEVYGQKENGRQKLRG